MHLDLLMISSRVFNPWGLCMVPIRHIHLSSKLFNLPHKLHLQPGLSLCFCCNNSSCVIVICSSSVILIWDFSAPVSQGHPDLKWASNPVPTELLSLHFFFVFAHLWVIDVVEPTYWREQGMSSSK